jgi:circadian clock protein KaiC
MGIQFLLKGASEGRKGLFVTFEEPPQFLAQIMKERGLDISEHVESGMIKIWHHFPKHFYAEELIQKIERELDENGAELLVLDTINDLERGIEDPATYKDYLTSLYTMLCRRGVTGLFIQKLVKFTASAPLTNIRYASLFDGVIYTGTIEIESAIHKIISILKMRGSNYLSDVREIVCNENGLCVMDKFVGMTGIMSGNARGQYKKAVEELLQPLYFIRDFIDIMAAPDVEDAQRQQIKDNIAAEVNKLIDKMCEKYDIKPEDRK